MPPSIYGETGALWTIECVRGIERSVAIVELVDLAGSDDELIFDWAVAERLHG